MKDEFNIKEMRAFLDTVENNEIPNAKLKFKLESVYDSISREWHPQINGQYYDVETWKAVSEINKLNVRRDGQRTALSDALYNTVSALPGYCARPTVVESYNTCGGFAGLESAPEEFKESVTIYSMGVAPLETIEDGVTYRSIWVSYRDFLLCIPHTDPMYKYMDAGSFFALYTAKDGKHVKAVFFKELTLEVFLVLHLLSKMNKHNTKVLQDECFIPAKNIRMIVLGLEKQFAALHPEEFDAAYEKNNYIKHKNAMNKQFLNSAEERLLNEFVQAKRDTVEKWDITFTHTTAKYEALSVEWENLIQTINEGQYISWSKQFDIYDIVGGIVRRMMSRLENGEAYTFDVNGMHLRLSKTNYRLSVNEHPINKDEVVEVVRRALCYTDVNEYNKLVHSVSKMSLLNHDALGNGLALPWRKLEENTSREKQRSFYDRDKMDKFKNMPRLRFKRVNGKIGIITDVEGQQHIELRMFTGFVRAIHRLFKQIDFRYSRGGRYDYGSYKDYDYAQRIIVELLLKHTSIPAKTTKQADGTVVTTPSQNTLTKEQAITILHAADTVTAKALARAKEFLESIVARVGAEPAEQNGAKGYKVKGKHHMYFVNEENNQVSSFETGMNICIVDSGHQVRVGHDELATRLMALKHDEKTMGKIGTLSQYVNR